MTTLCRYAVFSLVLPVMACTSFEPQESLAAVTSQVFDTERAFAATMAERDFTAFATFIDEEAVFIEQPRPLRGKKQVLDTWRAYFESPEAPFFWEPDQVEVLPSGALAHSSGPVFDRNGKAVARFNSIWRRNAGGEWKVIFDKGSPLGD